MDLQPLIPLRRRRYSCHPTANLTRPLADIELHLFHSSRPHHASDGVGDVFAVARHRLVLWDQVLEDWPIAARELAEKFWPGPLTIVVRKSASVPDIVTGGGPTVALRCPNHPVALALLNTAGVPIAAPSANRSGELSPTTAEHARTSLAGLYDLLLDDGPCPIGLESTVVEITATGVRILRPGVIGAAELDNIVDTVEYGSASASEAPSLSPGMLVRHYAPRTALECASTGTDADFLVNLYETAGLKVARYACGASPAETATKLYAELHALDAGGFDRIIAILPPDTEEWRAVRDRLVRAGAEE